MQLNHSSSSEEEKNSRTLSIPWHLVLQHKRAVVNYSTVQYSTEHWIRCERIRKIPHKREEEYVLQCHTSGGTSERLKRALKSLEVTHFHKSFNKYLLTVKQKAFCKKSAEQYIISIVNNVTNNILGKILFYYKLEGFFSHSWKLPAHEKLSRF